jgi:phage gp46-like protein
MKSDAVLTINDNGFYDISIDDNGDIYTEEFFTTAILYSLFGERRASKDEVADPQLRRGWIGNDDDFENGSKIWLLRQAKLTRDNLNRLEDEARKSLEWLVDDGYAVAIGEVTASVSDNNVTLEVNIYRSRDKVYRQYYKLWEATL